MGCGTSTASHVVPGKAADSAEPSGHSNYEPSKEDKGSNGTASESHNVYKSKRGRRGSISAEVMSPSFFNSPTSSAADLAVVLQAKTGEEREKILFQLRHVIMFAETEDLDLVVDAMQRVQVLKGDVLIKQGDEGEHFYLVGSGKIRVTDTGGMERFLMQDDCVGETALLYSSQHDFTAVAEEDSRLWALGRDNFRKAIRRNILQRSIPAEALQNLPMFECLTEQERSALGEVMDKLTVPAAKELEREHEQGDKLYILRKGKCTVTQVARKKPAKSLESASTKGRSVRATCQSTHYGVNALMRRAESNCSSVTATTAGKVGCYCLTREKFLSVVGADLDTIMKQRGIVDRLAHTELFAKLEPAALTMVAECLKPYFFKPGEVLFRQGDLSVAADSVKNSSLVPAMYIIERGECKVVHRPASKEAFQGQASFEVSRIHKRGVCGLNAVYPSAKDQQYTIDASCDVFCWGLTYPDLLKCMEASDALVHAIKNEVGDCQTTLSRRIREKAAETEQSIELRQLVPLTILGVGSFGQVKLVRDEASSKTYALKCMQKKLIVNYGQKAHVMNEKAILSEIRHPFVNRLLRTFKDRHYLYMLLEVVLGGELFTVLKRKGKLPDDDARFYASNITLFFEIMHKHHTVYRDLKPENMLVDKAGYIIVVDFGFAKKVYDKTYTLCGTTDYLAPEVIQHKGHNAAFDWWTLGIFIYELISGKTPFQADTAPAAYQNILTGTLYFSSVFSAEAKDLVKGLLHKNPTKRFGMGANGESKCAGIKDHPWFAGFDWDKMLNRELKSPWQPEWRSNTDTHNFDKYDERDLPPAPSDTFVDKVDPGWDEDF